MATSLSRLKRDIFGILWISLAGFLSTSLATYSPSDPSMNSAGFGGEVSNACGLVGSFLSDLLFQSFGIMAWGGAGLLAIRGVLVFAGGEQKLNWKKNLIAVLLLSILAALSSLHWGDVRFFADQVTFGGVIGFLISKGLILALNQIGVAIVLWTTAVVALIYLVETSPAAVIIFPVRVMLRLRPRRKHLTKLTGKLKEVSWDFRIRKGGEDGREIVRTQEPVARVVQEPFTASDFELLDRQDLSTPTKKSLAMTQKKVMKRVENWKLPELELLNEPLLKERQVDEKIVRRNTKILGSPWACSNVL
jgi:S-DNA-T family DNA segregation ATPase FtsK/SpoIIIE